MSYKIHVDEQIFDLSKENASTLDATDLGNNKIHVLQNNKAYHCELISKNIENKTLTVSINGNKYELKIEDEYDLLVKKMGLSVLTSQKISDIKAPMPGLIIDVLVEPGQEIETGTPILILEAMKMENVLKAAGEGIVKSIEVTKSQAVDKGQVLIEME
jgi:biotin carboxyl carrier protein